MNREWIDEYLNEAHSEGFILVRCRCNVVAWSDDWDELKYICNDVGSQLVLTGCRSCRNMIDTLMLFWAGIPGNEVDFPVEESFYIFLRQALCPFVGETNYKDSLSPLGIKMVGKISGRPLHIDISDLPVKKSITTNRNKLVLGPSESGKSFFTNRVVCQYHERGAYVLLVGTGNSYQRLSQLIRSRIRGEGGIYFTYTNENPIASNLFYTEDGVFGIEKKESIKTLILTLWKRDGRTPKRSEEMALSNVVSVYIERTGNDHSTMSYSNTSYESARDDYRQWLAEKDVREKGFDIDNFLNMLEPYYRDDECDYLLNSDKEPDLLHKCFIISELSNTKDHKILFPITTIITMEALISKIHRLRGIRKLILVEEV